MKEIHGGEVLDIILIDNYLREILGTQYSCPLTLKRRYFSMRLLLVKIKVLFASYIW